MHYLRHFYRTVPPDDAKQSYTSVRQYINFTQPIENVRVLWLTVLSAVALGPLGYSVTILCLAAGYKAERGTTLHQCFDQEGTQ